jgi:hypothetical protein
MKSGIETEVSKSIGDAIVGYGAIVSKPKHKGRSKGFKMTEEHKAKISAARKGKPLSEEHKAKISAANKGKHTMTEEHKDKIRRSRRPKYKHSQDWIVNRDKGCLINDRCYGTIEVHHILPHKFCVRYSDLDSDHESNRISLCCKHHRVMGYDIDMVQRFRDLLAIRYGYTYDPVRLAELMPDLMNFLYGTWHK